MLVEDEKWVRVALRKVIEKSALPIRVAHEAADGISALDWLREHTVDLVFTDIRMPLMDGITLLKEIRRYGYKCDVVIVSGHDDFTYARDAIRHGAIDYLLKPVEVEHIESCIAHWQELRRGCKPGSVSPVLQAGLFPLAPRAVVIYLWQLTAAIRPSVHFLRDGSPTKFGFLARRVYRVPSPLSPGKLRFCGTFSVLGSQGEPFPRRQRSRSLTALVCTRYEHSRHLSLGEPGLSSTAASKSDTMLYHCPGMKKVTDGILLVHSFPSRSRIGVWLLMSTIIDSALCSGASIASGTRQFFSHTRCRWPSCLKLLIWNRENGFMAGPFCRLHLL